jgi:hypothetical protein
MFSVRLGGVFRSVVWGVASGAIIWITTDSLVASALAFLIVSGGALAEIHFKGLNKPNPR